MRWEICIWVFEHLTLISEIWRCRLKMSHLATSFRSGRVGSKLKSMWTRSHTRAHPWTRMREFKPFKSIEKCNAWLITCETNCRETRQKFVSDKCECVQWLIIIIFHIEYRSVLFCESFILHSHSAVNATPNRSRQKVSHPFLLFIKLEKRIRIWIAGDPNLESKWGKRNERWMNSYNSELKYISRTNEWYCTKENV